MVFLILTFVQFDPANSSAWIRYAEIESQLEDFARTRAIFELGISQSPLSMPELLWKAYVDFEIEEGERETARSLYERLISLSGHVKVWISYALFEAEPIALPRAMREDDEEDEDVEQKMVPGDPDRARQVFDRAYKEMKSKGLKDEVLFHCPMVCMWYSSFLYFSALLFSKFGRRSRRLMVLQTTWPKSRV